MHHLGHEDDFGTDLHRELAGQLRADDNARLLVVIEVVPLDNPLGNQGYGPLLLWDDPHDAHPISVGCGTQQSRGQKPGTHASQKRLHGPGMQELLGRGHDPVRQQQLLGGGVLVPLRLNDDMPGAESHTVANHLLVAAIEQAQRDQQQGQTQAKGQRRQQGSAGIAPEIAPPDLHQQENTHHG